MRQSGLYRLVGVAVSLFLFLLSCATAPVAESSLSRGELVDAMWVLPDDSVRRLTLTVQTELERNPSLSEEQQKALTFKLIEAEVKLHAGEELTVQAYP